MTRASSGLAGGALVTAGRSNSTFANALEASITLLGWRCAGGITEGSVGTTGGIDLGATNAGAGPDEGTSESAADALVGMALTGDFGAAGAVFGASAAAGLGGAGGATLAYCLGADTGAGGFVGAGFCVGAVPGSGSPPRGTMELVAMAGAFVRAGRSGLGAAGVTVATALVGVATGLAATGAGAGVLGAGAGVTTTAGGAFVCGALGLGTTTDGDEAAGAGAGATVALVTGGVCASGAETSRNGRPTSSSPPRTVHAVNSPRCVTNEVTNGIFDVRISLARLP